ncbi:MAG: hypothetical protein IJR00_05800 [Lachnospiraceae bacterium]|nr:hypothetical protein [Lachnospiraceae bacterium]
MNQLRKRYYLLIPIVLIFGLLFALTRMNFSRYPAQDLAGNAWDRGWEMLGTTLGIESQPAGMTLLENNSVLAGEETYYATYVSGEGTAYVNAEGEDVTLYPEQCYLLLYGCADQANAEQAMADWMARTRDLQTVTGEEERSANGATYTLLHYRSASEDSPYDRGASAFYVYDRFVIVAEMTCTPESPEDPDALLDAFLSAMHLGTP